MEINHSVFKDNYSARNYHGDTILDLWGKPTGKTITTKYYYKDTRTILPNGDAMVVWAHDFNGGSTPGFLKGFTRVDALKLAGVEDKARF